MISKSIILVFFAWISLAALVYELLLRDIRQAKSRDVFLLTSMIWGCLVVIMVEGLSLFTMLLRQLVFIFWGMVLILALMVFFYLRWRRTGHKIQSFFPLQFPSFSSSLDKGGGKPSILSTVIICLVVFQVLTLAMVAYQFVPTNYDSMTYHLARVMHWIQNQSVAPYATNIDRQVQMPPFAEYMILNLQIMLKRDQFANLVQWFAMVISVIGVSGISAKIGANRVQQFIAALLCAFIPMGILQATSTQNDYVLAACIVCFIYFFLSLIENPDSKIWVAGSGIALGLSLLTKGTAYVFVLPFVAVFGIYFLIRNKRRAVFQGLIIILTALLINLGFYAHNYQLYKSPLGPSTAYQNEILTPASIGSNLIRNTALQVPIHSRLEVINITSSYVLGWMRLLHQFTNLNPTDPRTTLGGIDIFIRTNDNNQLFSYVHSEDYAGNPIHAMLILITLIFAILNHYREKKSSYFWFMVVGLLASLFLFSAIFKWQIWGSRLQLSMFVLWCAVIPVILFASEKWYIQIIPIFLALYLINWTFTNNARPITGSAPYSVEKRSMSFFSTDVYPSWSDLTQRIVSSKCDAVGLSIGLDSWEYPLWVMLDESYYHPRIEHIGVSNATRIFEDPNFKPCAIVSEGSSIPEGFDYIKVSSQPYLLFLRKEYVTKPVDNPAGFYTSGGMKVLLGQGWYDFEPDPGVRWMQGNGSFWVYADQPATVLLTLKPYIMNVNKTFGVDGVLDMTVNRQEMQKIPVTNRSPSEVDFKLNAGYNFIQFKFEGGSFIPNQSDSSSTDWRSLGIAFYPITISIKQDLNP